MRLLLTIPSLNPKLGGPSEVAVQTALSLCQQGIEVEIATTNDFGEDQADYPDGVLVEYRGVPTRFFQRSRLRRKEFIPSYSFASWASKNIKNYDLLELNYVFCFTTTLSAYYGRSYKVPYVVRTLGQLSPWCLEQSALLKTIYKHLFELKTLNSAAAIRTSSEKEAQEIREYGVNARFVIEPHGVSIEDSIGDASAKLKARYSVSEDKKIILFLSRIHPKKRLELLIESVSELAKQGRKDLLVLAAGEGDSNYVDSLKTKARELGVADSILYTGFISGTDKALAFQGSDIYVLPSYQENFGVSVAEALAYGVPSIISDEIHIAKEIDEASAGLVISPSVEALAASINSLIYNEDKKSEFSGSGKSFARSNYSWPAIGKRLASHYKSLI